MIERPLSDPAGLASALQVLVQAITQESRATVRALPPAGEEVTLLVASPSGVGRLVGKGGSMWEAVERLVRASSWSTAYRLRVLIDERDRGEERDRELASVS